jgi:hypothetical protein
MGRIRRRVVSVIVVAALAVTAPRGVAPQTPAARVATPAPPEVTAELRSAVARARARFEARDLEGVLAAVSDQYRSSGLTKRAVRDQLAAMLGLYQEMRARVDVDDVQVVDGAPWVYTTGEIFGRLPMVGWVTVLSWAREPEVARREGAVWRLYGFQD